MRQVVRIMVKIMPNSTHMLGSEDLDKEEPEVSQSQEVTHGKEVTLGKDGKDGSGNKVRVLDRRLHV